jgi:quinol monooxygenase YgiN
MIKFALLAKLEAKPGKEKEVEEFLKSGANLALREPKTITWYAFQLGPSTFGIFDTFEEEDGRKAHLSGEIAKALMQKAPDLFSSSPNIQMADIIGVKTNKEG